MFLLQLETLVFITIYTFMNILQASYNIYKSCFIFGVLDV